MLFRLQNKFRKIPLLISYILSDQVWWCNIKQCLSYSKNCICKFMQANSWHHKLFIFHLSFWIWKLWKEREKIRKIWKSWEWKELFRWNRNTFHSFWRTIIWWKNKNLIKISDTTLSVVCKCQHISYLQILNLQSFDWLLP